MYKIAMRNPNYKWLDLYDIHELAQLGKENAHRCTIRAAKSENMEIISEHYREEEEYENHHKFRHEGLEK